VTADGGGARHGSWRLLSDFELAGREIEDIVAYLHSLAGR
jgi:hypothetical protein